MAKILKILEICGMKTYKYKAYLPDTNQKIVAYLKERVGIRGIAQLLQISPVTVIARIKLIASTIEKLSSLKKYIKLSFIASII